MHSYSTRLRAQRTTNEETTQDRRGSGSSQNRASSSYIEHQPGPSQANAGPNPTPTPAGGGGGSGNLGNQGEPIGGTPYTVATPGTGMPPPEGNPMTPGTGRPPPERIEGNPTSPSQSGINPRHAVQMAHPAMRTSLPAPSESVQNWLLPSPSPGQRNRPIMGTNRSYATNYRGTGNPFIDADADPTVLALWHEIFGELSSLMAEPEDLPRKDVLQLIQGERRGICSGGGRVERKTCERPSEDRRRRYWEGHKGPETIRGENGRRRPRPDGASSK